MRWPWQKVEAPPAAPERLLTYGEWDLQRKEDISLNQLLDRLAAQFSVASGESVTPQTAMRCTTVQGIVRALTNAIGSYPVSVVQSDQDEGTVVEQPRHAVYRVLQRPNGIHTSVEFFRLAMEHVLLWGNFYGIKGQASTGPIAYIRPIENPDAVTVDSINWGAATMAGTQPGVTFRVALEGGQQFIHQSRMVRITGGIISSDGVTGQSPVMLAKEAIGICLAAERLIAELYANNDVPSYILKGGEFRDEEQFNLWLQKFREHYGGGQKRGSPLLLPKDMDAKEMSFKPVDAQLLEMRKFQRLEIAQVYGVPPHKLADLERATFSNIEEQSLEFVRDVAKPYIKLFQQSLTRDLLTADDQRSGFSVRFDMEEATEGKLVDRLTAYGKAHEVGAMNPNEIRRRIGLNPRKDPGGNDYVTALNMRASNVPGSDQSAKPGEDDPDPDAAKQKSAVRAIR